MSSNKLSFKMSTVLAQIEEQNRLGKAWNKHGNYMTETALVNRGMVEIRGPGYWITDQGRAALGIVVVSTEDRIAVLEGKLEAALIRIDQLESGLARLKKRHQQLSDEVGAI